MENYLFEDAESPPDEASVDALYEVHRHPFDINMVTKEQLETLPFLSDKIIEEILSYRYRYGEFKSLDELQLVYTMDFETFQYLKLFLTITTDTRHSERFPTWKQFLKYGKRTIIIQGDFPLYWKEGYKRHTPEILEKNPNKEYIGQRFSTALRFDCSYRDKISVGFTAEKDAGEPFFTFTNKNKGFDSYSFYFFTKDMNKWLKTLAVGNYRLGFGQGLIMNTDFSMGKQMLFTSTGIRGTPIRKHASLSEYNFFRGIASTIQVQERIRVTAFYSFVNKDANIDDNKLITSWKNDGYHRTPLEISKKGNTVNQIVGGNIDYNYNGFHIGLTGVHNNFNHLFKTYDDGYRKYYPKKKQQWNISTDYRLHYKQHSLQGEVALSNEKAIASIHTLRIGVNENWQLLWLHRFYSYKFNAVYGRSFSEGSLVKNESGVSTGVRFTPSYQFNFMAYADVFYFPWETYKASPKAKGYELYTQSSYALSSNVSIHLRYRFKSKQQDHTHSKDMPPTLRYYSKHTPRLQTDVLWRGIALKTGINYTSVKFAKERSQGFLASQSIRFPNLLKMFDWQINGFYFHTDNYETRLSAYESGLLYQFGFTSFYGHGYRLSTTLRYKPLDSLWIMAKFGHTRYFDRNSIGSGLELSEGSSRENISLQMRYKF